MAKWGGLAILALVAVLFILVPLLPLGTDNVLTLFINVFLVAGLASSWNILAGFAGQISLGHAAFFGIGSLVTRQMWLSNTSPVVSFAAGGASAALVALVVGAPVLRLKGIYFAIGTLALAQALELTIMSVLPRVSGLPGSALRDYTLSPRYYLALGVAVVIAVIGYGLSRSRLGLGVMAAREDEAAARSIGINVFWHRMIAFVLSAALAGFVGATFAFYHPSYYLYYPFSPEWTFDALLVTFVGGVGSIGGPLVGAVFFVSIRDTIATYLATLHLVIFGWQLPDLSNAHLIIFGVVFILVVLMLPGGLVEISTLVSRWVARRSVKAARDVRVS